MSQQVSKLVAALQSLEDMPTEALYSVTQTAQEILLVMPKEWVRPRRKA